MLDYKEFVELGNSYYKINKTIKGIEKNVTHCKSTFTTNGRNDGVPC